MHNSLSYSEAVLVSTWENLHPCRSENDGSNLMLCALAMTPTNVIPSTREPVLAPIRLSWLRSVGKGTPTTRILSGQKRCDCAVAWCEHNKSGFLRT